MTIPIYDIRTIWPCGVHTYAHGETGFVCGECHTAEIDGLRTQLSDARAQLAAAHGDLSVVLWEDADRPSGAVLTGDPDVVEQVTALRRDLDAAMSAIPRHLHIALANATRAITEGDDAALGTINEAVQPLVDAAMTRIRTLERKGDEARAQLEEARADVERAVVRALVEARNAIEMLEPLQFPKEWPAGAEYLRRHEAIGVFKNLVNATASAPKVDR